VAAHSRHASGPFQSSRFSKHMFKSKEFSISALLPTSQDFFADSGARKV
jgi:hypothetical protein